MLNLVTVCTDTYPLIYADKLHRKFDQLTNLNVEHYCITDRPEELNKSINPICPFKKSKGWWNKLNLFSPKMPQGYILYMDLDIVILNNFDEEIIKMSEQPESMCCVSDAIEWMGVKFSSSLMCFRSGIHEDIFNKFAKEEPKINDLPGGDQVWTGPQLTSVSYIDDYFPDLKKNFKFHIATQNGNNFEVPRYLDNNIKLLDCGGRPKPHELESIPYVKQNWHDI